MVAAETITPQVVPGWSGGVLESFYRVAFSRPDTEIAGLLVGRSAHGAPAHIDAVIPLHEAGVLGAGAAFSHQGWSHAHELMARHYHGLEIVGWYVSRPGRGTALTPAEAADHHRWFPQPHQVALVLDSVSHRGALFAWHGGRLVERYEGPVERRYTRAPRPRAPWRGYTALTAAGAAAGAASYVLSVQVLGT